MYLRAAACVIALLISAMISAQVREPTAGCGRSGLRFQCPAGWFLLSDELGELAIASYNRDPDTPKTVFGGKGKAWISIQTQPSAYKDLAAWIYAGHKLAPEAVERPFIVQNGDTTVRVTCLESPAKAGPAYSSAFFQIGNVPVLLELNYHAEDLRRDEYQAALKSMIAGIRRDVGNHK
jgi:hypothetical protein